MTALTVVLLVVGIVSVLWWLGIQPVRHRNLTPAKVRRLLESLMRERDGTLLFVESPRRRRFVQVLRYEGNGRSGLELDFPRAPWSEPFYDRAKALLKDRDVTLCETQSSGTEVLGFVSVDFGKDLDRAADVVWQLATKVLDLDMEKEAVGRIILSKRKKEALKH